MGKKTGFVQAICQECEWAATSIIGGEKNRHAGYYHHRKTGHRVMIRTVAEWFYEPR